MRRLDAALLSIRRPSITKRRQAAALQGGAQTNHMQGNLHKLILCIARRELDAVQHEEVRRLVQQPLNWDYLFSIAQAHGLLPLLHKNLSSATDIIPAHFLSRLKRESVANSQNVLHLIGSLHESPPTFIVTSKQTALRRG